MHAASRFAARAPGRPLILKALERAYRWRRPHTSKRQQQAAHRFRECRERKSDAQIREELERLQRHWDCYPFHYFRYDLFRQSRDLPLGELLDYIPEFFLYHVFLPLQEGRGDPAILGDKMKTAKLFDERGIAQPEVLGGSRRGRWHDAESRPCEPAMLLDRWAATSPPRIFLKPVTGSGGAGIVVARLDGKRWIRLDGTPIDTAALQRMASRRDWLAQAGVRQVEETARYYPSSVNTFRINTSVVEGRVKDHCAVIRIGGGGRELDNATLGGIMLGVELASGRTTPAAGNEVMETFPIHPDSGHRFVAEPLRVWPAVRDFTLDAAARLSEYTHVAWDIAATVDGPRALEANIGWGVDCYQSVLGGLAAAYDIDDPARYWR